MLDTLRNFTERLHREFTSRVPRSKAARAAKRRVQREVDAEFIFPPIPEKMLAGAKRFKNGATPYRDRRLPLFYVVDNHPKRPEELRGLGRDFIYAWKSRDREFVDTFRRIAARDWEIQMGPNDSMDEHGLLWFQQGDIVWVRDIDATVVSPDGDNLQAFVLHPGEFKKDEYDIITKKLEDLRDRSLGTRETRTKDKVAFEKTSRASKIKDARCYSIGLNTQKPRNVAGPAAGNKVYEGDLPETDEDLKWRRDVLSELSNVAVNAFKLRQPDEYEVLDNAGSLFNTPRIGCHANSIYTGGQMNLAVPHLLTSSKGMEEMKIFGKKHYDGNDSLSAHSLMTSNSDLPEGYEGGRFQLVELGAYVRLEGLMFVSFSGLRWHGGTPPLATDDVLDEDDIPGHAYRWVFILYPQAAVLDGRTTFNIAAEEDHTPFQLTAAMRDVSEDVVTPEMEWSMLEIAPGDPSSESRDWFTQEINFCADGTVMMEAQDLVDFTARASFMRTNHTMRQLPGRCISEYNFYRQAFTVGGLPLSPWTLAPDGATWVETPLSTDVTTLNDRQLARRAFQLLCASNARFIVTRHHLFRSLIDPIDNGAVPLPQVPSDEEDVTTEKQKGRPKTKGKKSVGSKSVKTTNVVATKKRKRGKEDDLPTLLLKPARLPLVTTDASQALRNRVPNSRPKRSNGKRAATEVADLQSSAGPPPKRPRRKIIQPDEDDEVFNVKKIVGHKLEHGKYAFLCAWEQSGYDDEYIMGAMMDMGWRLQRYCEEHHIDYESAHSGDVQTSVMEVTHECTNACPTSDDTDLDVDDEEPADSQSGGENDTGSDSEESDDEYRPILPCAESNVVAMDESKDSNDIGEYDNINDLDIDMLDDMDEGDNTSDNDDILLKPKGAPAVAHRYDVPFLNDFAPWSIPAVIDIFKAATNTRKGDLPEVASTLDAFAKTKRLLTKHPLDEGTACAAAMTWPLLSGLGAQSDCLVADSIVLRWLTLRAHHELSVWINVCLSLKSVHRGEWIFKLADSVESFLTEADGSTATFNSNDFLQSLPIAICEVPYAGKKRHTEMSASIHRLVITVICKWFNVSILDHDRSRFLRVLRSGLPVEVFLLPGVWTAYMDPTRLANSKRAKTRPLTKGDFERLRDNLANHVLLTTESCEQFAELGRRVSSYLQRPSQALPASSGPQPLPTLSISTTPTGVAPTADTFPETQRMQIYVAVRDFLRSCLPLMDDPALPMSTMPNWEKAVNNLDYYLPFREKSPSRVAILESPNSPYSLTNIRTPPGIFSAMVYRGILYNTQALHEGARSGQSFMFSTLAEWKAYRGPLDANEAYYCNIGAYGTTNLRSSRNADAYWDGSRYVSDLVSGGLGFKELVHRIATAKAANGRTMFVGFGKLTSYLFVVDLVYAGAVKTPSLEELADVVIMLDKGAMKQLVTLGVPATMVREEFIGLCRFLSSDEGLTPEERDSMGFDGFVGEHGLCKRGRFWT